ncbi:substrate-binding domain-containing protein [uncultured Microbacterium sp.]|uniref:substrate-binding domain-containing protein n=1 Tax=uncultured Microbacterium sp. TaxID=191216 RepID=UPI0035CB3436
MTDLSDEDPAPLFALQRQERLMDELRAHGAVAVGRIAVVLGVSELTIRRDINALARRGLVTRVHGGATIRSSIDESRGALTGRDATVTKYTIGMVVPSLDYYWPEVVSGARVQAAQLQSRLMLRGSLYDARDNRKQVQVLVNTSGMHGLIVAPHTAGPEGLEMLRWLDSLPIPVVLAERRVRSAAAATRLESVVTDHAAGAMQAVRHLYAAGHRRIGLLTEPQSPTTPHVRRGWKRAIASLGLTPDVVNTDAVSFDSFDRETVIDEILAQCTSTGTTALLILSDPQAVAFEQHCADRGVRIPDDIAIVAYDDEVARLGHPAITAVRPPKQFVGRGAVDLLVARLEGGRNRPPHHIKLTPELLVRESSM